MRFWSLPSTPTRHCSEARRAGRDAPLLDAHPRLALLVLDERGVQRRCGRSRTPVWWPSPAAALRRDVVRLFGVWCRACRTQRRRGSWKRSTPCSSVAHHVLQGYSGVLFATYVLTLHPQSSPPPSSPCMITHSATRPTVESFLPRPSSANHSAAESIVLCFVVSAALSERSSAARSRCRAAPSHFLSSRT